MELLHVFATYLTLFTNFYKVHVKFDRPGLPPRDEAAFLARQGWATGDHGCSPPMAHVCTQGSLHKTLLRVLSLAELQYVHAHVVIPVVVYQNMLQQWELNRLNYRQLNWRTISIELLLIEKPSKII